ncbi:MAG TPA: non-heme iron oxygenase ferredoxin subunit [Acidimicrobiia bacterium]|nr:non-heme iron oxygenase ferredoxin subunit [Acidimicrobiia bacterium]
MSVEKVASFSDLKEGVGFRVDLGEHRVAIFLVDGALFALGDRCSHAEASLSEGEVFDMEVECPRHGSAFDLATGEPRSLPATKPVPVYRVWTEDGDVFLAVDE